MFRRTFWFTAGAAAGVWATTKVNRKLRRLTPESLAAQAADKAVEAGHRLKELALDVRAQMAQREAELGEVLGLNADPDPERVLPAGGRRPAVGPAPVTYLRGTAAGNHRTTQNPTEDRGRPGTSYNRNEDH
ncbi:hypothetical protein [Streptomyces sp. NPDC005805]|uniref:hypothetical protein n=1 Tax=Streptomyces sp. NPDC005805 TaxID=3157068 RepID=UPI0033FA0F03